MYRGRAQYSHWCGGSQICCQNALGLVCLLLCEAVLIGCRPEPERLCRAPAAPPVHKAPVVCAASSLLPGSAHTRCSRLHAFRPESTRREASRERASCACLFSPSGPVQGLGPRRPPPRRLPSCALFQPGSQRLRLLQRGVVLLRLLRLASLGQPPAPLLAAAPLQGRRPAGRRALSSARRPFSGRCCAPHPCRRPWARSWRPWAPRPWRRPSARPCLRGGKRAVEALSRLQLGAGPLRLRTHLQAHFGASSTSSNRSQPHTAPPRAAPARLPAFSSPALLTGLGLLGALLDLAASRGGGGAGVHRSAHRHAPPHANSIT